MGLAPRRYALAGGAPAGLAAAGGWRTAWTAFAICFVALIALFWPTVSQVAHVWSNSASYNHGFLILPICGYLVWIKRGMVACQVPQPSLWGIGAMLIAGFDWLLGYAGSVAMVQQFALVFMLQGLVLAIFGVAVARALIFPLGYLLFAVPFGEFMIPPLQDLTAVFVVKGLQIVGIPVYLDGVFLSIPTGNFQVAEACSGARFLISTVALGTLFAHITYRSHWRKAAFVLLSVIVPIVANGFRAFGIVLLAYLSNNQIAVGVDHIVYGWVFFSFITIVLLLLGMTFRDGGMVEVVPDIEAARAAGQEPAVGRRIGIYAIVAVLAGALAPTYANLIGSGEEPGAPRIAEAPMVDGGWRATGRLATDWMPVYPTAHARLARKYVNGADQVDLYIAYFTRQRHGAELIHVKNTVANRIAWGRAATSMIQVKVGNGVYTVERTRLLRQGRKNRIAYRWYWVGGRFTASPYVAKILQALGMILPFREAAASIIVSAAYDDVPDDADRVLKDFLGKMHPIAPLLERASESR